MGTRYYGPGPAGSAGAKGDTGATGAAGIAGTTVGRYAYACALDLSLPNAPAGTPANLAAVAANITAGFALPSIVTTTSAGYWLMHRTQTVAPSSTSSSGSTEPRASVTP